MGSARQSWKTDERTMNNPRQVIGWICRIVDRSVAQEALPGRCPCERGDGVQQVNCGVSPKRSTTAIRRGQRILELR